MCVDIVSWIRPCPGSQSRYEGGTRATAFVSGGFVPKALRGTTSGLKLVGVYDWYATFSTLAGVDPTDDVYIGGVLRSIDSVDVWPMLIGANLTQPRPITPTTEASIVHVADDGKWWKLITKARLGIPPKSTCPTLGTILVS